MKNTNYKARHYVIFSCRPLFPHIEVQIFFPRGIKWQGREADHLPPYSVEIKKYGAIPPLAHMSSCLVSKVKISLLQAVEAHRVARG
jgi:hypothetical protein